MPLNTLANLNINNTTVITCGCSTGSSLVVIDNSSAVRTYSIPQLSLQMGPKTISGSTPCDITMVAAATAAIAYYSTARVDYININTGDITQVTTAAAVTNNMQQQIAGNTVTGLCMSTRGAGLNITQVLTTGATTYTPAQLTGTTATCIITRQDTNTWLVGTASSTVLEYNQYGTLQNILTIPLTPNTGTVQTTSITNLAYSNGNLVCATDRGVTYVYNWNTQTQLAKFPGWDTSSVATGCILSQAACGVVYATAAVVTPVPQPITEIYMEGTNPTIVSNFWMETSLANRNIVFDGNRVFLFQNTSTYSNVRMYNSASVAKTTSDTRTQIGGIDTNARILRLRDDGIGTLAVEVDQNVAAGDIQVSCTNNKNYIEIALATSGTQWDVREFTG